MGQTSCRCGLGSSVWRSNMVMMNSTISRVDKSLSIAERELACRVTSDLGSEYVATLSGATLTQEKRRQVRRTSCNGRVAVRGKPLSPAATPVGCRAATRSDGASVRCTHAYLATRLRLCSAGNSCAIGGDFPKCCTCEFSGRGRGFFGHDDELRSILNTFAATSLAEMPLQ